ncbi:RSP_2648 family PIN domain-containing protein [Roseitranquillus sediminis]|uniref:RSP_2648 family PIN domain-containing protein n=1 Tax=Roseitranquillus sediminis TaxID=2809051 RepID=UPI001D0C8201|nr:PIN domain-containing protein [Roseitranquillus sediminis]MBM9594141.1 PIN domain-containing protein [Roseitranquillus sediminis]
MKVLIDACVLYPTVLREIVLGACTAGLAQPLWSARILEEWARAAARLGPGQEAVARGEVAAARSRWPGAEVTVDPRTEARLHLPDPNDVHVLAAAIDGGASVLLTLNVRDFPARAVAAEGVARRHPDEWLTALHAAHPQVVAHVAEQVRAEAERLSAVPQPMRPLMKRARLPRFGKALERL